MIILFAKEILSRNLEGGNPIVKHRHAAAPGNLTFSTVGSFKKNLNDISCNINFVCVSKK